jgi:uncharacterized protein YjbJ (UPF0337 family)
LSYRPGPIPLPMRGRRIPGGVGAGVDCARISFMISMAWNHFARRGVHPAEGKVRQQWAKLTDDDVELVKGKRTELAGRIQQRYGVARDEAERQIDTWMKQSISKSSTGATSRRRVPAAAWARRSRPGIFRHSVK